MSMHNAGWRLAVNRWSVFALVLVALALPGLFLTSCHALIAAEPDTAPAAGEPSKAEASPAEPALVNSNQLGKNCSRRRSPSPPSTTTSYRFLPATKTVSSGGH